jgi:nitrous oxidase accessory protein NosD
MSFDVSRVTFDPWKDHNRVIMEQGRVQLDSDWNEWVAEVARRIRAGTLDTLGHAVYPASTPKAFLITPSSTPSGPSFTIGVGRMYVDGLLAENHGLPAPLSGGWIPPVDPNVPPPAPGTGPAWDPALDELVSQDIDYLTQPYYPDPAPFPGGGPFLVYLDVWQREVTFLQDPDLIEKAIGFDTSGRIQTVWQVRFLDLGGNGTVTCSTGDSDIPKWKEIIAPAAGRLTTGVVQSSSSGPCCLAPNTGYTGMENQNYRVVVHLGGTSSAIPAAIQDATTTVPGTATFKWSRNNGSVATGITAIADAGMTLTVQSTGKDDVLRFNQDDWVEITDDWRELNGLPGELRQVAHVTDAANTIELYTAVTAANYDLTDPARHTRLIKWDQARKIYQSDGTTVWWDLDTQGGTQGIPVPPAGTALILENGITVSFGPDPAGIVFRTDDHWSFAARTLDGTVEKLIDAPPAGIHHHYARLAILPPTGKQTDCRVPWPPDCGGCCAIEVAPGEDVQAALDSVPEEGGCVCLKTGIHLIQEPLHLRRSKVVFKGESPGAIIRSSGVSPVLFIGDPDVAVTDVVVEGIRFEATTAATVQRATLIAIENATRVRIEHCDLADVSSDAVDVQPTHAPSTPFGFIGVTVMSGTDLRLLSNRIENVLAGIVTYVYDGILCIAENILQGTRGRFEDDTDASTGVYGIATGGEHTSPCRIENNRISDFWTGVYVGRQAAGSTVSGNEVLRRGGAVSADLPVGLPGLRAYLDGRLYAIDVLAAGCEVRDNRIKSPGAKFGGIRARGLHPVLASNVLEASGSIKGVALVPAGITCVADAKTAGVADHAEIRGNRLTGAQTGIVLSQVDGAVIAGNHIDGAGSGWYGVLSDASDEARIEDNDLRDIFYAVYLSEGERNRVLRNRVDEAVIGVSSLHATDLEIAGNSLRSCLAAGAGLVTNGSTALLENRVMNCGFAGPLAVGIEVLADDINVRGEPGMTRIANCEVLDTGLPADGKQATSAPSLGIAAWLPACQITDNRVGYTTTRLSLDPRGDHRALLLAGPRVQVVNTAVALFPILFGSAQVTSNHFRGPGSRALVEFVNLQAFRFEKVTFDDNLCDHQTDSDGAVTLVLWGGQLIVGSNHVKALRPFVRSMSLNDATAIALVTGNVTTGARQITAAASSILVPNIP